MIVDELLKRRLDVGIELVAEVNLQLAALPLILHRQCGEFAAGRVKIDGLPVEFRAALNEQAAVVQTDHQCAIDFLERARSPVPGLVRHRRLLATSTRQGGGEARRARRPGCRSRTISSWSWVG